ncbi:MAG: MBL fold metallo-hydrolase [Parvularculaceae bacterium]|nr:MBL fold metallo-hydrolase [Parvularculaceae bacterium]
MRRVLAAALTFLPACAFAQPDYAKLEVKATKVAGNVYVIEDATPGFSGGNIGVSVGPDGILLVDSKFAPLAPKIEAALKAVSDQAVRFVLNTHFHADHSDGNRAFAARSTVIAHEIARKRIAADVERPTPANALPVITFEDSLTVHVNGEEIRAVHFPSGHTDTDVVVFFTESNVVHLGDKFFSGTFPFVDLKSGGSAKGLVANLERLLVDLPEDVRIIPGHGPVSAKADLKAYVDMIKDCIAIVEAGVQAGKSARKMKSERALSRYADWSWSFITEDRFIDQLYEEIRKK